ncbi:hypothetical protein [uncultured Victivallis sp.]|uniref:hypothetical protein n=1 Tax=uncultured Victivallis sp. TaxID=354118 RepID=UPI0025F20411|nr:hypothetical protein [uncultured Victivallis sp.]
MAKHDFISDNLVHMRERLKENAARAGAPAPTPAAAREEKTGREPAQSLLSRDAMRQAVMPRGDGFDRQRRDFGCRLERDRASVAAELELQTQKMAELERFAKSLAEIESDFRHLPPGETPEIQREFEKVRFAYYRAAGRVSAFLKEGGSDSASAPEREGIRNGMAAWLPVAAAMIVSALIVALTLVVLFY